MMYQALQQSLEFQAVDRFRAGDTAEFHVIVSLHQAAMFRMTFAGGCSYFRLGFIPTYLS